MRFYAAAYKPGQRPAFSMLPEGITRDHPDFRRERGKARVRAFNRVHDADDSPYGVESVQERDGHAYFADVPGEVMEWACTNKQPDRV